MIRRFSSYGPINTKLHYFVARQELIDEASNHLIGESLEEGGHYITVWAPRQRGKSWIMQQVMWRIRNDPQYANFDVLKINLEHLKMTQDVLRVAQVITNEVCEALKLSPIALAQMDDFYTVFKQDNLTKPLILILDEFDSLPSEAISGIVGVFRNIYNTRRDQLDKPSAEKQYLLHSVALIGVRSVLGVENRSGSPFNVQRSLHIPNLTFGEVESMFNWYERESGQTIEPAVIQQLYSDLRGQPGLTSWFGELLTETYNQHNPTLTLDDFAMVYAYATQLLPNSNILNIISKAKDEPQRTFLIDLLQTDEKVPFRYDDPVINHLYMNGVIDEEITDAHTVFVKFPNPFVQKRLFNYFANELYSDIGTPYPPFTDISDTLTPTGLNVRNLLRHYQQYLQQNREWIFNDVPRKSDLRPFEAVYHFNLYMWLTRFLQRPGGQVLPEFPTGNGQIDLIIRYQGQVYGVELKSFSDDFAYRAALKQAARYARTLNLSEITVVFFVDAVVDQAIHRKYETSALDKESGLTVFPVLIATGN